VTTCMVNGVAFRSSSVGDAGREHLEGAPVTWHVGPSRSEARLNPPRRTSR
jgi:hypothetical protein